MQELYEPLWDDLWHQSKRREFNIRAICMADLSNQGGSRALNEDTQGDDLSWFDHSRDLLYMINLFRDEMARPMVGVGHRLGGTVLVNLAIIHPRLFSTLVLFDPVIQAAIPQGNAIAEPALTLSNLPILRPSVLYVFGQLIPMSTTLLQNEKMATTGTGVGGSGGELEGRVTKVVLSNAGHLLTMEAGDK
ncbi:hypothetical protein MMC13_004980 [Lambiella insularis]|nr:hypothetical protein [Lambiella insularis]